MKETTILSVLWKLRINHFISFLFNLTGHYAIGYMALSEVALACFIIVVGMFY
ncbi:MAG: hypothetical protein WAM95_00365 [Bacillus sp. (in: firmicutes)]